MRASNFASAFATIAEWAALLARKKVSPVELLRLYLARIERLDPRLNSFRTVTAERALADARRAERELARGRHRGPLHGIPIAIKDNLWTRGVPTTAGSLILRDFVPAEDATVVRRLRRAGAVMIGKTNMHEFAYGITSENPHYGPTHNPWALDRISAGSSGGSAAAVAAGLCVAAVGTDTGGSIRVPAALCGIVGLKPTFGRVSVHGVIPLVHRFDHLGVLARSSADAALLLNAIAGRDPRDASSAARRSEDFARESARKSGRLRLGLPREYFWEHLDSDVARLAEAAVDKLARHGARVRDVKISGLAEGVAAANTVALVEALRYHEQAGYFPSRAAEYGADVRDRLEQGGRVGDAEYREALAVVARSRSTFAEAVAEVDALVAPAAPIPAPSIGASEVRAGGGRISVRAALVGASRPANFTGLPAIALPCGLTRDRLPAGMQLIGRAFGEVRLLQIARFYERIRGPFPHPQIADLP